ncbi:MAG: hypothetical protein R3A79_17255 [Nannocystaceae bacterium]
MRRAPRLPLLAALLAAPLLGPASARADALPYDADTERPIKSAVVVRGVDRLPDHDVVLYPSSCPTALAELDMFSEEDPEWAEAMRRRGPVDFAVLKEGARLDWRRGDNYCADSHLYAIPKGLADALAKMTTAARQGFWRDDPRVIRTTYSLPWTTIAKPKRARLRAVEERVEVLAIDGADLRAEIESMHYRFAGGDAQTVAVRSVERPEYPDDPLTPAQLAAAAAAAAVDSAGTTGEPLPGGSTTAGSTSGDSTTADTTAADTTAGSTSAADLAPPARSEDDLSDISSAPPDHAAEAAPRRDTRGHLWLALAAGLVAIVAFVLARRRR